MQSILATIQRTDSLQRPVLSHLPTVLSFYEIAGIFGTGVRIIQLFHFRDSWQVLVTPLRGKACFHEPQLSPRPL